MSIINSDGLNTNWQLNVLKGLQGSIDELKELNIDTAAIEQTLLNIETTIGNLATEATLLSIASDTSEQIITPFMLRVVNSSLTFPGGLVKSISFSNVGTANALVKSVILKPGETINFDAGALGNFYLSGSFPYDCTTNPGAELLIIYNV